MEALWRDATHLINTFKGERPLSEFLKGYYKLHHRLGSRDRKILGDTVFSWYRAANGFTKIKDFRECAQAAILLCGTEPRLNTMLPADADYQPEVPPAERAIFAQFQLEKLLPAGIEFSEGIVPLEWAKDLLQQPQLFVRLRPHAQRAKLLNILRDTGVAWEAIGNNGLSLPSLTPLHTLWPGGSYVVQDWASQKACETFHPQPGQTWWDCCAGAGGKSLYLADLPQKPKIVASDLRPEALAALQTRFKEAGLPQPVTKTVDSADTADVSKAFGNRRFDGVICDVPCTGSGTWGRTPEAAYHFKGDKLAVLTEMQQEIAGNAAHRVAAGGMLHYITCSVFKAENEDVVAHLLSQHADLDLVSQKLINGGEKQSDSLFVAVLRKKG